MSKKTFKMNNVYESFEDFIEATEVIQKGNSVQPAQFGANPDDSEDQYKIPFEFERSPEIGDERQSSDATMMLERLQAIADAGVNKSKVLDSKGIEVGAYVDRQLQLAYKHIREAYLRMMDMR